MKTENNEKEKQWSYFKTGSEKTQNKARYGKRTTNTLAILSAAKSLWSWK